MNKIVKHAAPQNFFADHFYSVESVTPEGNPFTFARIFHNKHGRTNMVPAAGHGFIAGGRNRSHVLKYAKTVDPQSDVAVFIERGYARRIR